MEWVHRARCKDVDPELFFPVGTTGPAAAQIDDAKAVCMGCDVRLQCLEWALATGLGLQIARTLVESELGGTISFAGGPGTTAVVTVPVIEPVRP